MFAGEIFDPLCFGHQEQIALGVGVLVQKPTMRVYVALFTTGMGGGLLYLGPSPYRHNRYPFTPVWGKRRGRDRLPYGMIRGLRGMQEDINKRASKALHILSTDKTFIEEGAVDDHDETADEISRSDAYVVLRDGGLTKIKTGQGQELYAAHMQMMERSIAMIQRASGVTDENKGFRTNATSGIAIEARQDQGAVATSDFFDNLRFAVQVQGEKQLANLEQFMAEEKQFRITNMRGKPEFIAVNDGLPENSIVRSKADFVVDEANWRASMRQAAVDQLLEAMTKLPPDVWMTFLDLVVENMDLPNREEIVRRIRDVSGQMDPDADEPTEEDIARQQGRQQQAARQAEMENAQLRKMLSESILNEAKARETLAQMASRNIESMGGSQRGAMDIAADLALRPELVAISDEILSEAGAPTKGNMQRSAAEAAAAQQPPAQAGQPGIQQQQETQQPAPTAQPQPTDGEFNGQT